MKFLTSAKTWLATAPLLMLSAAHAGIGDDIKGKINEAGTEANIVYVAVIGALAAFFVVKLIRKAL